MPKLMANGHVSPSSRLFVLFILGIIYNDGRLCLHERFSANARVEREVAIHGLHRDELPPCSVFAPPWISSRHVDSAAFKVKGYFKSRVSRYSNSVSTFQITRLLTSGDISENPGPGLGKLSCYKCTRTIARNHWSLVCSLCGSAYHIKCGNVTPKDFKIIQRNDPKSWSCLPCLREPMVDTDFLSALPFGSVSDESFLSTAGTNPPNSKFQPDEFSNGDYLHDTARELKPGYAERLKNRPPEHL